MEMSSKTGVDAYMEIAHRAHGAALELAQHALSEYIGRGVAPVGWERADYAAMQECLDDLNALNPYGYHYGLFGALKGILVYYEDGVWAHLGSVVQNCIELARAHG